MCEGAHERKGPRECLNERGNLRYIWNITWVGLYVVGLISNKVKDAVLTKTICVLVLVEAS